MHWFLCCRFSRLWQEEMQQKGYGRASVVRVMLRFVRTRLVIAVFLCLISVLLSLVISVGISTLLMLRLLLFMAQDHKNSWKLSNPCLIGIHHKALAFFCYDQKIVENYLIPVLLVFIIKLLHFFVMTKCTSSSVSENYVLTHLILWLLHKIQNFLWHSLVWLYALIPYLLIYVSCNCYLSWLESFKTTSNIICIISIIDPWLFQWFKCHHLYVIYVVSTDILFNPFLFKVAAHKCLTIWWFISHKKNLKENAYQKRTRIFPWFIKSVKFLLNLYYPHYMRIRSLSNVLWRKLLAWID